MADPTNANISTLMSIVFPSLNTEGSSETSPEDAAAFFETKKDEYTHIKKMYRFFRKSDTLDIAISDAVECFLETTPELPTTHFSLSDIAGIVHGLPLFYTLMIPDLFFRVKIPFGLLRRCLNMHLVYSVTEEMMNSGQI